MFWSTKYYGGRAILLGYSDGGNIRRASIVLQPSEKQSDVKALREKLSRELGIGLGAIDYFREKLRRNPSPGIRAQVRRLPCGTVNDIPLTWTPVMVRKERKTVQIKMRGR